jgi:signal transduction histidine kinase
MLSLFLQIFNNNQVSGYCTDGLAYSSIIAIQVAPPLLLYSYIPAIIVALTLSIIIFKHNKQDNSAKSFLFFSIFYSLWVINAVLQWILIPNYAIFFAWHLNAFFEISFYLSAVFLLISFVNKGNIHSYLKYGSILLLLVIIGLTPTVLNISSYDYENCEGILGIIWNYIYIFEFLISLFIIIYGIFKASNINNKLRKKEILLFSIPLFFFITLFTLSNISSGFLSDYSFELFGPIGMVIFISFISYLIVKYQSFDVKLIATQVLVLGLVFLIGSQFFFIKVTTNFILNGITFIGVIILGQFLIKSVKREVEQREKLEILTNDLSEANEKLKGLDKLKTEFVSLASHQLRSPLTAIKGYTSMLLEGDYGEINPEAKQTIDRVMQSSNNLTLVVEDLLNVSKIESGGMKYVMEKFDFGELAQKTAEELSINAEKRGLKLISNIQKEQKYFINGDKEKIRQIVLNLIDNSIKYTKEGQIEVGMTSKDGKITMTIKDTGVGIEKGKEEELFDKFTRGEGSKINASGSGLGLYLVREIAKAHGGRVWAESEGAGKGSTFFVEFTEVI